MRLFDPKVRESQVETVVQALRDERAAFTNVGNGDSAPGVRAGAVLQRAMGNSTDAEVSEALRRSR